MVDGEGDGRPGGDDSARILGKMLAGRADGVGPLFGSRFPVFKPGSVNPGSGRSVS
jgi:hypothetical protein